MASRIRSSTPRSHCAQAECEQRGRALMNLVLNVVARKSRSDLERKQSRIVMKIAAAMLATLRSAPAEKTAVRLADLNQLDDMQFDRIIKGLHYMRMTMRQAASRQEQELDRTH